MLTGILQPTHCHHGLNLKSHAGIYLLERVKSDLIENLYQALALMRYRLLDGITAKINDSMTL